MENVVKTMVVPTPMMYIGLMEVGVMMEMA